ncbi:MAG: hypothetical protein AUG44_13420 [Actinobacteria bacterium 13_1_20CM_3_71_11]|nr:MAG: hypothetical protein AUG44_13420 [Actinobacteria bacterium 13_1_20CM_3_71_11]
MDLLDRVYPVAAPLLDRVDASLAASGAPADHPIWPLLRRLGSLPGELVVHLAGVSRDGLTGASDALRRYAGGYRQRADEVPMPAAWRGPAAEAYGATWSGLAGQLAGGPDTLTGRLEDTASYLDDVTAWLGRTRRALAGTVAECLGSAEALALKASSDPVAAATIGAHILAVAAEALDDGRALHDRWAGRLAELAYRPVDPAPAGTTSAQLRLG